MKILLHVCCGPCAIVPFRRLFEGGHSVEGYFFNPNIHPLSEYLRRRDGAILVAGRYGARLRPALEGGDYDVMSWLKGRLVPSEGRCPACWKERLERAAALARRLGFDAFTTSLLYSKRQRHEEIAALGRKLGAAAGVDFYYEDFRVFWREGINVSKEWGVYRQQYCGCLFSESERYANALRKSNSELAESWLVKKS